MHIDLFIVRTVEMCHKGSHCIVVTKGSMISFWLYLFCHAINDDVRICTTNFVARLNEPRFRVPILNGSFFFSPKINKIHTHMFIIRNVFFYTINTVVDSKSAIEIKTVIILNINTRFKRGDDSRIA